MVDTVDSPVEVVVEDTGADSHEGRGDGCG